MHIPQLICCKNANTQISATTDNITKLNTFIVGNLADVPFCAYLTIANT